MTKGEKLFSGALAVSTIAGTSAGYYAVERLNNTPTTVVEEAEESLYNTDENLNDVIASLPLCARIVVGALGEIEFVSGYNNPSTSEIIQSQCSGVLEDSINLVAYEDAVDLKNEAALKLEDAKEKNEYDFFEKITGSAGGMSLGFFTFFGATAAYFNIKDRITNRKVKKEIASLAN